MTRNDLVEMLMTEGFSYREARSLVAKCIDEMKKALKRGEDVDLPFGVIHPVKNKRVIRAWRFKRITVMGRKKYKFMFRQKKDWT